MSRMDFQANDGSAWNFMFDREIGATVTRQAQQIGHVSARDLFDMAQKTAPFELDIGKTAEAMVQLLERDCSQHAGAEIAFPERASLVRQVARWLESEA